MILSVKLLHMNHECTSDIVEKCLLPIFMQVILTAGETQLGKKTFPSRLPAAI